MATQEEMNKGLNQILMLATDLLKKEDHYDINFIQAQSHIRHAFFKYLDLNDCPFRNICRKQIESEYEDDDPEPPYNWRDDRD